MKKNIGRKERRNLARGNRKSFGRFKMKIHNWQQKIKARNEKKQKRGSKRKKGLRISA